MKKNPQLLAFSSQLFIVMLLLVGSLTSCSYLGIGDDDEKIIDEVENKLPADEIYAGANSQMEQGYLQKAIKGFEDLERLYPFSPLAAKAKVKTAVANYYDSEYDKAIDIIDEFVTLNPGNEEIEFMYYLKAICYYDRIQDVKRDQEITVKAQKAFEEVMNRFPESKYARDAKYKLDLIKDHLAAKEMEVGRFYIKQENYIAALNRFKEVVKNYDDTQQIEEALYRLVEANMLLGFEQEALRYGTILGYNYPSSKWYKRSYALLGKGKGKDKTFVGKVLNTFGLGAEPEYSEPAQFQSSPNLVDTGGWISDDAAIEEAPTTEAAPAEATPEGEAAPAQ